jgi:nicotinamidase-related amidase
MKPLLLLVDLQKDFLGAAGLEPVAAEVVAKAARLLAAARAGGMPVVHAVTSVGAAPDDRMPHWKAADRWKCVPGTRAMPRRRSSRPPPANGSSRRGFLRLRRAGARPRPPVRAPTR